MTTLPSGAQVKGELSRGTEAVAVLLHGASVGAASSTSWLTPVALRVQMFAPAIRTSAGGRIQVIRLRHPDRDWKTLFRGAVGDTAQLLAHIRRESPQARIALVGHSNGGRVALRLSADSRVDAVAALAPWITSNDRFTPRAGQPLLLMHGSQDRITDPKATAALADTLRGRGCLVDSETVLGENHALLMRSSYWHRRVAGFLATHLLEER